VRSWRWQAAVIGREEKEGTDAGKAQRRDPNAEPLALGTAQHLAHSSVPLLGGHGHGALNGPPHGVTLRRLSVPLVHDRRPVPHTCQ
jgi:hypothetical protein